MAVETLGDADDPLVVPDGADPAVPLAQQVRRPLAGALGVVGRAASTAACGRAP
ncbi:hypothetical protein [Streptomyces winkii]|uniref:hypothetical protein n=1 Tax=Streptomyces winkii TaxID=3051178 RepID=UPI0028D0F1CD|nr:hypothetical protein [Streptomyces sp. DSM 40971]